MNNCKLAEAVNELLSQSEAVHFREALNEFWEGWMISEYADGLTGRDRADKLMLYKQLTAFLATIESVPR